MAGWAGGANQPHASRTLLHFEPNWSSGASFTMVGGRRVCTDRQRRMIIGTRTSHSRLHGTSRLHSFSRRSGAHLPAPPNGLDRAFAGRRSSSGRDRARTARVVRIGLRNCRKSCGMASGWTAHLREWCSVFWPRNAVNRSTSRCRLPNRLSPKGALGHASPAHDQIRHRRSLAASAHRKRVRGVATQLPH